MTLLRSLARNALAVVLGWQLTVDALAWSVKGHAEIAERALAGLSPPQQTYFEQQAAWLINKARAKKWRKGLNQHSDFAKISVWPDTRRELTIEQLFTRFGAPIPKPLSDYAAHSSYRWHYVNAYYHQPLSTKPCQLPIKGELVAIWPTLLASYASGSEAQRAVVLAFIVHLLADANQPLHTLAAVDATCESDAGGNGFCLQTKGKRCALNLHQLWDRGFGVFDGGLVDVKVPSRVVQGSKLSHWQDYPARQATDHQQLASRIYSLTPNHPPPLAYNAWAQAVVSLRANQAARDLTELLRVLYEYRH